MQPELVIIFLFGLVTSQIKKENMNGKKLDVEISGG